MQKIDYNSNVNQDIKGQFVNREVYTCFSYEMDNILNASMQLSKTDLPTWEDIENFYTRPEECYSCGQDISNIEDDTCPNCNEYIDMEMQEIFEWWIISEFLYNKLRKKGYCVLDWGNNYYWGRCCTGQAILLDTSISYICEEMEILEGQKYSWERK